MFNRIKVPKEHLETMEVLREALYLMSGMGEPPDYTDFWQFRSRIFEPLMREVRYGSRTKLHEVLERWLLRKTTTEEAMDALKKLEAEYET